MVVIVPLALAFASAVAYELTYLGWLYCADRGWPLRTALLSMASYGLSIFGIMLAVHDGAWTCGALCLGYGVGSYLAALWKARACS